MINKRKYLKLNGICGKAIQNEWCLGCQKLEDYNFIGVDNCEYINIEEKQRIPNVSKMVKEYKQLKLL